MGRRFFPPAYPGAKIDEAGQEAWRTKKKPRAQRDSENLENIISEKEKMSIPWVHFYKNFLVV